MRFGILGPVEVWDDTGEPVAVGGPQQRALLAVLLLHANRVVSAERLIDHLWERPPATARSLLQGCVAGLRRVLTGCAGPGRLVTRAPGYLLQVRAGELDLDRFEELVASARADGAGLAQTSELLSEALALWRGPALADVTQDRCRAAAAHLDERRLATVAERIDIDLQLGPSGELVVELQALVRDHPLRERLWVQLILALYRSDRKADALAAYQDLRRTLVEQLGVEPGPEAQRLQRTILTGEPARPAGPAPAARPAPAQLPAPAAAFVGRDAQLKLLEELLADPDGGMSIGVISGMAGVGKTTLAVRWAHRVRERFGDGQLYVNLRGFDPTWRAMTPAEAVRGFLAALGIPPERLPSSPVGQIGMYRSLLASRRMLVLLDNAADAEQVRPLLPGSPECLVLVTSRHQLSGLVASEAACPVPLDLLTDDEARQLLARRLGSARVESEPAAVDRILARCAGLPLALATVAARAAAYPDFPLSVIASELGETGRDLDRFASEDPATDVRAVLSWSYHALDAEPARLFRLLALHPGPDIGPPAAASLAGRPVARVRALLATLARANLVTEHRPGRFGCHDLLRVYAAEQARTIDRATERQAAIHRVLDHYLHTAYAADRVLYAHRDPIAVAAPRAGASPEQFADGTGALAWFASELPVVLAAVDHAAAHGLDTHTWQLAFVVSGFLDQQVRWLEWAATQRTALAAAQRLADPAAEALAHRGLGRAYTLLGRYEDAAAQLRQALDRFEVLGDRTGQATTHHRIGWLLVQQGRVAEALSHANRALELHRTTEDESGHAGSLNNVGWCLIVLGRHRQALAYCAEARSRFEKCGNRSGQASAWDSLGHAHQHLGEHRAAVACYQRALDLLRGLGDPCYRAEVLSRLGDTYHRAGRPDRASEAWHQALSILEELGHPRASELRGRTGPGQAP